MAARLERIERSVGELKPGVDKLWAKVKHLEPAVQAVLRQLAVDPSALPFPERLQAQRFRLASQNQEDGITLALVKEMGQLTCRFVELGSGLSGGNSAVLARECGWTGLMVDGHAGHIAQVVRRFPRVTAVAAWVTREEVNALLQSHGLIGEIDVLSIDLDGNDYWVWEAIDVCSPKLAIVEYNSSFGPNRAVTIPYDPHFDRSRFGPLYYGASLEALARLATRKGYRLVAVEPTGVNAFFLRNDVAPQIPASPVNRTYRLLEKYDVMIQHKDLDVFGDIAAAGLPLVEIP
jgi:hypothetical protein